MERIAIVKPIHAIFYAGFVALLMWADFSGLKRPRQTVCGLLTRLSRAATVLLAAFHTGIYNSSMV